MEDAKIIFGFLKKLKLKEALDYSRRRWGFCDRTYCYITKKPKKTKILVLGSGGVGKSTFAKIINGHQRDILDEFGVYTESLDTEFLAVDGHDWAEVEVVPGQERRLKAYWDRIRAGIREGKYEGIILVSAYGYHSLGLLSDYKQHRLFVQGNSKPQWLEKYLQDQRDAEKTRLSDLIKPIQENQSRFWFLHYVGKRDLWFRQEKEVHAYYLSDFFANFTNLIESDKDADKIRVEKVFGSLEISNFVLGSGDVLTKNSPGYTQKEQSESLNSLMELVSGLLRWKHGQEQK